MKPYFLSLVAGLLISSSLFAQPDNDPVLFKVQDDKVLLSEFKYIYEKNNGTKADYSEASLKSYLDLYINFKLKVQKAKEMGLDKDEALRRELDGYRKQLSSSFLTDREIVEKLVKQAYERSKKDVHISHILISIKPGADASTEAAALEQANTIKNETTIENFAEQARLHSNDPSAQTNKGDVGFFTVFQLPFELENAVYGAKEGTIIGPIRTNFGYHVVWVHESRPARGQVQASHILLRTKQGDEAGSKNAETKINEVYAKLQKGEKWEDLVKQYSEDNSSKEKEGNLGWFGINKYDQSFEDKAFGLKKDGDYSAPFATGAGWHIVKRLKAVQSPTYEEAKTELSTKVKKDSRFEQVQKSLVEKIKKENGFSVNAEGLKEFKSYLGADFMTYQWKVPEITSPDVTVYTIGSRKVSVKEFAEFANKNPIERTQMKTPAADPLAAAIDRVMEKNIAVTALQIEEANLDKKYPEYRALMREYEEGILLFEATKKQVWDKASSDTTGLKTYYNANKKKYKWPTRTKASVYTINSTDVKLIESIQAAAKKKPAADVAKMFNASGNVVSFKDITVEKGKDASVDALPAKAGSMSKPVVANGTATFTKIEKIIKPVSKTLQEAKGYVVADYQDYLGAEWVKQLRKQYKVEVDQTVFKGLKK